MSRGFYFDRDGNPYPDVLAWARDFENMDLRQVKLTRLKVPRVYISTIWEGLDNSLTSWLYDNPMPLIFETAINYGNGWLPQVRWPTLDHAVRGHDVVADRLAQEWWLTLGGRA